MNPNRNFDLKWVAESQVFGFFCDAIFSIAIAIYFLVIMFFIQLSTTLSEEVVARTLAESIGQTLRFELRLVMIGAFTSMSLKAAFTKFGGNCSKAPNQT